MGWERCTSSASSSAVLRVVAHASLAFANDVSVNVSVRIRTNVASAAAASGMDRVATVRA